MSEAASVRWRLAAGLRGLTGRRQATCRLKRILPNVQFHEIAGRDGKNRLVMRGVETCGSGHSCPLCAPSIYHERGEEIQQALRSAGHERVVMATLTLRHSRRMALRALQRLLSLCHSELWAGRAGRRLKDELGKIGHIRSHETNWGSENGWHPHLHVLWFFDREHIDMQRAQKIVAEHWRAVVSRCYERLRRSVDRSASEEKSDDPSTLRKYAKLWGAAYLKDGLDAGADRWQRDFDTLGSLESILPTVESGVALTRADNTETYLTKMGLEVSGICQKNASEAHATHWEVYRRAAAGNAQARVLVQEHYAALKGTAIIAWSPGLRKLLKLRPERPDETVPQDAVEFGEQTRLVAHLPGDLWSRRRLKQRLRLVRALYRAYERGRLTGLTPWSAPSPYEPRAPVWWHTELRKTGPKLPAPRSNGSAMESALARELAREELRHQLHDLGIN